MNDYFELIKELGPYNRCHSGPEMKLAYEKLTAHYPNSTLIQTNDGEIFGWKKPPYWSCHKATLIDEYGEIIADKNSNNLHVFTYSQPVKGTFTLQDLTKHLLFDRNRPDSLVFHFRNQYRHWNPEWGFSITYNNFKKLKDCLYFVTIETSFDLDQPLIQSEYLHKGETDKTYLFFGHFDHPSMVNDGLAGVIAAYETIKRLNNRKTKFSYCAFASVEIYGSISYLYNKCPPIAESLFLSFVGIKSNLSYQTSFEGVSLIDKITYHISAFYNKYSFGKFYKHREIVGNDENVFDSVGYEIPCSTLLRNPFPEYHTDKDSIDITYKKQIEEIINFCLDCIFIIENNCTLMGNFKGIPCLAHPDVNLYLDPSSISGLQKSCNEMNFPITELPKSTVDYLNKNNHLLNQFMNNIIRLCNSNHTLLEICSLSQIPFDFGLFYVVWLEKKNIITKHG